MTYKLIYKKKNDLISIQTREVLEIDIFTDMIKDIFNQTLKNNNANILLDFRNTREMKIDNDEIKLLSQYARSFKTDINRRKIAFIINDYKQQTVITIWIAMVSSFVNISNIQIFQNESETNDWLGVENN